MSDFESRLRAGLRDATHAAPTFVGLDPCRSAGSTAESGDHRRSGRSHRWLAAAAAAAVVVAGAGAAWRLAGGEAGQGGGGPAASCAARLVRAGHVYTAPGNVLRMPRAGAGLGEATLPTCDDGSGSPSAAEQVEAFRIPGVSPGLAFLTGDHVWTRADAATLPQQLRELTRPVPCTGDGESTLAGRVTGVDGPPVTEDFHLRTPWTATFVADRGASLPLDTYADVTIRIRVADATAGGRDPDLIRGALTEGDRITATVRCDGDRFVATSLKAS